MTGTSLLPRPYPGRARLRLFRLLLMVFVVALTAERSFAFARETYPAEVAHGGYFPVVLDGKASSVLVLTTSFRSPTNAQVVLARISERTPIVAWDALDVSPLSPASAASAPLLAASVEDARHASGPLLGGEAVLLVMDASEGSLVGSEVVTIAGIPASFDLWRSVLSEAVGRMAAAGSVSEAHRLRVDLGLSDGSVVTVRAGGAMVSLAMMPQGRLKEAPVRYPDGSFLTSGGFFWRLVPDVVLAPSAAAYAVSAPPGTEGPSAGLSFALAYLDSTLEGGLSAGRVVAASGTVDRSGEVGPVGGFPEKGEAARAAGAEIMLVGAGSMHFSAPAGILSAEVSSVAEAVGALCPGSRLEDVRVRRVCARADRIVSSARSRDVLEDLLHQPHVSDLTKPG